jgi:hypothetical protein
MAFRKLVSLTTDHLYSILFVVEGSGKFPAEMLTVDRCLPRTEDLHDGQRAGSSVVAWRPSPLKALRAEIEMVAESGQR